MRGNSVARLVHGVSRRSAIASLMTDPQKTPPSTPPDQPEELAHYDDAVIGRAFRWSAAAAVLLVIAAVGIYLAWHRKPAKPAPQVTAMAAPKLAVAPDAGRESYPFDVKITPPAPAPKPVPHKTIPKCKKGHHSTKAHPCHK